MKANRGNRPPAFNNNRGPGGANRGSGSAGRSGPGGPLMTEHLQLQVSTLYMLNVDSIVRWESIY